jgi:hypothetical protein
LVSIFNGSAWPLQPCRTAHVPDEDDEDDEDEDDEDEDDGIFSDPAPLGPDLAVNVG